MQHDIKYLPASEVLKRYNFSQMTLWRYLNRKDPSFPKPFYFGRRRYFRLDELQAWEQSCRD